MVDTPKVELNLGGTWTDVSSYVRYANRISITRGQRNEGSSSLDTSACSLTFSNDDGRFTPRNPTGAYYGMIGRNTPLRVSVPYGQTYFQQGSAKASNATAPDASALDITGDIDIRIEYTLKSIGTLSDLCGRWGVTGNQISWAIELNTNRTVALYWSTNGSTFTNATSTVALPASDSRIALRVTLDVNNGASGHTATFYTSDSISGSWTQLGDAVTASGTTSIFGGTADLEVGCLEEGGGSLTDILVHAFELRNGIGGTVVANPDFTTQTVGDTSFTDAAGRTWTINGDGRLDDRLYRFAGEISSWPPGRDISGKDATVSIQAAGISRRLKQGESTLRSPMYREFSNPDNSLIKAYWPMEDDSGATQIASGKSGVPAARILGTPSLASYSEWTASDPIPEMSTGAIIGTVPAYSSTGEIAIRMFVFMPGGAVSAETSLLHLRTTGSARQWEIRLTTGGDLITKAWDDDGDAISGTNLGSATGTFNIDSLGFAILNFELATSGSNVTWKTQILDFVNTDTIDDTFTSSTVSGTVSGQTVGVARTITVGKDQGLGTVKVGHLAMANDTSAFTDTNKAVAAHNGEDPADRFERLCEEEEITATVVGEQTGNAVTMGDQTDKALLDLLQECVESDGGLLYEPRDSLGFAYRTRLSLYNQPATLTLSCADHELNEALQPVDDDQRTLNDITVKRVAGSSTRVEQTTGPLSTQAPEDGGVGRYDTSVDLSLEDDGQLADQAGWRLHLGTVDEARYPKVQLHLASPAFDATLRQQALAVDVGDRLVITDPSADLPPDDISQLVIGYAEVIDQFEHVITYVCQPETPWHVGQTETDGYDRIDAYRSILAADATSTATTISVGAPTTVTEDFEDTDYNIEINPGFSSKIWERDSSESHGGSWSLSSGTTAFLTDAVITVPKDAMTMTLWYKIGPQTSGTFTIFLDSAGPFFDSEVDWTEYSVDVSTVKTVRLDYTDGDGTAYVDDITFTLKSDQLWTADADDLPFDIVVAGERMTVTAVSGTSSPQTLTVTRSVNGVVKAHDAGTEVHIAEPVYVAL